MVDKYVTKTEKKKYAEEYMKEIMAGKKTININGFEYEIPKNFVQQVNGDNIIFTKVIK